nr:cytochrome P450 82C4-like [Ipomoea trifida]
MDEWLAQLTLNTSCRIVAGRRYKFKVGGAVSDDDSSEYKEAQDIIKVFREFQYLSGLFVLQDAFPLRLFKWFDFQGHVRAMKRNNKKVDKILQTWIDQHIERRQLGNAPAPAAGDDQDLIDLMLSTIDKEFVKGLPHTHQMAIKGTTQISHLTIARLIQGFDFSTPGNVELDMEEGLGVTLPRATPLQLVVTPRLPPNFYGV